MSGLNYLRNVRMTVAVLAVISFLAACGGSSNENTPPPPPVTSTPMGTVVLLLTDAPSEDFSEINLEITEAKLIGGAEEQIIFSGNKVVNLLDLQHFTEVIALGEVVADTYTKIRLQVIGIELVHKNTGEKSYPSILANGKIDLLDSSGFTVSENSTLLVVVDVDANKSIHVISSDSGSYKFRPVVKVNVMVEELPDKLSRLDGIVTEIFDVTSGRFLLCDAVESGSCIVVNLLPDGSVFDADGLPVEFDTVEVGDAAVVIGNYRKVEASIDSTDLDVEFDAVVMEVGGNATLIKGIVNTAPDSNGLFQMTPAGGATINVQLQAETKIFGDSGEIGPDAIVVDAEIDVEGVVVEGSGASALDTIRAALVFVDSGFDDELLSGSIAEPIDLVSMSFNVATGTGDFCVETTNGTIITLVSEDGSGIVVTEGEFSDLESGQLVDIYGQPGLGGCFAADEIVVDLTLQP